MTKMDSPFTDSIDAEEGEIDDLPEEGVEIPIEGFKRTLQDEEDVLESASSAFPKISHWKQETLTHAEKWDDSVLIEAWDSAVEQYRVI